MACMTHVCRRCDHDVFDNDPSVHLCSDCGSEMTRDFDEWNWDVQDEDQEEGEDSEVG